jgi:sporulation protein YlmC with PRC-barrel domain
MRTSEIAKRPVVTMAGSDVAQVKDIIYAADGGAVGGFTLAGRGLFAGPLDVALPWRSVTALGPDAVMIDDADVLRPADEVLSASRGSGGAGGDILGSRVLTDTGVDLGEVVDVIVEVSQTGHEQCDVVGYEISPSDALGNGGNRLLIPLPDTLAASGEHLIVPESAKNFVRQDLAGFGAAVDDFRALLRAGDTSRGRS